jgi:predicted KAP-like P-loop ATPase
MIEVDKPIIKEDEDCFSRVDFVKSIAEHIKNNHSKEACTIIGLHGSWGTGKSSLINLLNNELIQHNFFTNQFNPWRYSTEVGMLTDLFKKIKSGAKSKNILESRIKKLGNFLSKYQDLIILAGSTAFPAQSAIISIISKISNWFVSFSQKKENSLDELKNKINKILEELESPLVIFIDDVDRLNNTEIRQLFKILKLTADFNNLIYIVAFDDDVVSNVLNADYSGKNGSNGGKEFLDKIINIPLPIPHLSNHERHLFLINRLLKFSEDFKITLFDEDYEFNRTLRDCSFMLLKTPRDVKRVINSISFLRGCLKQEVSINDLIILEIVRLYAPEVFHQIIKFKDFLFNKPLDSRITISGSQNNSTEAGDQFLSEIKNVNYKKTEIVNIITYLFPFNSLFSPQFRHLSEQFINKLSNENRVGLKNNFDRYLKIGLNENELSTDELNIILNNIQELELDESLLEFETMNELNFVQVFEYLKLKEDTLTQVGKFKLYQIYCISNYFNRSNELDFMMAISPIHHVIKRINGIQNLNNFLKETVPKITSINRRLYFISQFKTAVEEDSSLIRLIEPTSVIATREVQKVLDSDVSVLFNNPNENRIHDIMKLIYHLNLEEIFKEKVLNYVNKTGDILEVAIAIKHKIFQFGKTKAYYDDEVSDEYFVGLESLLNRDVLKQKFNELKEAYPLDYSIIDEKKKISGIIVHKYFDFLGRKEGKI